MFRISCLRACNAHCKDSKICAQTYSKNCILTVGLYAYSTIRMHTRQRAQEAEMAIGAYKHASVQDQLNVYMHASLCDQLFVYIHACVRNSDRHSDDCLPLYATRWQKHQSDAVIANHRIQKLSAIALNHTGHGRFIYTNCGTKSDRCAVVHVDKAHALRPSRLAPGATREKMNKDYKHAHEKTENLKYYRHCLNGPFSSLPEQHKHG